MKIYKNPNLILSDLDDEYFACINTCMKDGLKIINITQKSILDSLDHKIDFNDLVSKSGYTEEEIQSFVEIFKKKNILNYSGDFSNRQRIGDIKGLNLRVHTTDKCNLRCSYCYITTHKGKSMDKDTMDNLVESILTTVKKHKLKSVTLRLSGGEPTLVLNKRVEKINILKESLGEENCKLKVALLSNGTTLNEEKINTIKESNFGIGISLDGMKDYQNENRVYVDGKGSFDDVIRNIKELIAQGIKPNIMTVVSNESMDGLVELTKYLVKNDLKFRFSFVQGQNLDQSRLIEILHECYDIIEKAIQSGYKFSQYHKLCDLKFLNPVVRTCGSGYSGGAIYLDGGMHFCQLTLGENEDLGNINNESDMLDMISRGKDRRTELSEDCTECIHKPICTGGCPIERKEGKDPHCNVYKSLIPRVYNLLGQEKLFHILKQNNV